MPTTSALPPRKSRSANRASPKKRSETITGISPERSRSSNPRFLSRRSGGTISSPATRTSWPEQRSLSKSATRTSRGLGSAPEPNRRISTSINSSIPLCCDSFPRAWTESPRLKPLLNKAVLRVNSTMPPVLSCKLTIVAYSVESGPNPPRLMGSQLRTPESVKVSPRRSGTKLPSLSRRTS